VRDHCEKIYLDLRERVVQVLLWGKVIRTIKFISTTGPVISALPVKRKGA
jgi:hypothetical protein